MSFHRVACQFLQSIAVIIEASAKKEKLQTFSPVLLAQYPICHLAKQSGGQEEVIGDADQGQQIGADGRCRGR
jgi:hypothetical protein